MIHGQALCIITPYLYKVVADKGYNTESLTVDHSGLNVRENHAHGTLQSGGRSFNPL
jgi:hypothetical protein